MRTRADIPFYQIEATNDAVVDGDAETIVRETQGVAAAALKMAEGPVQVLCRGKAASSCRQRGGNDRGLGRR